MIADEILKQKINALPPQRIEEVVDFIEFLTLREKSGWRAERTASIAAFAEEFGGTEIDLDEELEKAGVECLLMMDEAPQ